MKDKWYNLDRKGAIDTQTEQEIEVRSGAGWLSAAGWLPPGAAPASVYGLELAVECGAAAPARWLLHLLERVLHACRRGKLSSQISCGQRGARGGRPGL